MSVLLRFVSRNDKLCSEMFVMYFGDEGFNVVLDGKAVPSL